MISVRPSETLKRIAGEHWGRAVLVTGTLAAVTLTVTAGLAVARSGPAEPVRGTSAWAVTGLRGPTSDLDAAIVRIAMDGAPDQRIEDAPGWAFGQDMGLLAEGAEARRINSAIPFSRDGYAPAAPFQLQARSGAERKRALRCLANAVYYEAALEPVEGQRAVAQVVLNRVRDPNFPKSICGVVYEGWERVTGCQFSFTCDGALGRAPEADLWDRAKAVAEAALSGYVQREVGAATHYHADYVAPYWAPSLVKIAQIGAHIFYRWPGEAGLPQALTAAYQGGELRLSEAVLSGRAARPQPVEVAALDNGLVKTVVVSDGAGGSKTRVTATVTPEAYGRRAATPDEIARINAILEERFPTKTEASATTAAPAPPAPATPVATAETASAG